MDILNNREWAILLWTTVVIGSTLHAAQVRSAFRICFRALKPEILVVLAILLGWSIGVAILVSDHLAMGKELWKGLFVWYFSSGVVLLFEHTKAMRPVRFAAVTLTAMVGVPAVLEAYANLFTFSLIVEIVLQPLLLLLTVAPILRNRATNPGADVVHQSSALQVVGLTIFSYVTYRVVSEPTSIDIRSVGMQLMLPFILTTCSLPIVICVAVYSAFESALVRCRIGSETKRSSDLRFITAMVATRRFSLTDIHEIEPYWARKVHGSSSFRAAREQAKGYFSQKRLEHSEARMARRRLRRLAGVKGTDAEGRQLDRREFAETTEALDWISTCMIGWHRRTGEYRDNLLSILGDALTRRGLPSRHGIEIQVSEDGDSWVAWRRCISGWCFAIGSDGPHPNTWRYDGAEPPSGFPGQTPEWGESPFSSDASRNW